MFARYLTTLGSNKKANETNVTSPPINNSKNKSLKIVTPPSTPIQSAEPSVKYSVSLASPHEKVTSTQENIYSVSQTLKQEQYSEITKVIDTLQGSIYKVRKGQHRYMIKVTNKELHNQHITKWNGHRVQIEENVIKEAHILKYLTSNTPPKSLVKYIDFFADEFHYFFVMEYGGQMSLFEFVKKCHQYITHQMLDVKEWHKFCKIAMKQMTDLVDWLHNTMNCCHLDVSLENFVIDNVTVLENQQTGKITFLSDFQIKIIDFGVAEVFYRTKKETNAIDFACTKYVGKTQYKSPEVYAKKRVFDARSADCHSLFVCFFIMFIGCPPWYEPCVTDITFNLIMTGHLNEVITEWNRTEYITPNIFGLLSLLFKSEKYRLTIKDIQRHPWLL